MSNLYVQTRYRTNLNGAITDVQNTCLVDLAPAQTQGFGTYERDTASEEDFYWGNLVGLQMQALLRGLSKTALTVTEVAGNKLPHVDNALVEGTLLHYIINNKADRDGDNTFSGANIWNGAETHTGAETHNGAEIHTGLDTFADDKARSASNAAPTTDTSFSNKKYVDDHVAAYVAANAIGPGFFTSKGGIATASGAGAPAFLAVGADGTVLTADSGAADGLSYQDNFKCDSGNFTRAINTPGNQTIPHILGKIPKIIWISCNTSPNGGINAGVAWSNGSSTNGSAGSCSWGESESVGGAGASHGAAAAIIHIETDVAPFTYANATMGARTITDFTINWGVNVNLGNTRFCSWFAIG